MLFEFRTAAAPLRLNLPNLYFSLIFQTLYSDKEGLVKLKNAVKDMRKAGNGEFESVLMWDKDTHYHKRNLKLSNIF